MRVSIDSEKLDLLANVISDKSGEAVPMTLAEMTDAVDGIQTGGGTPNLQSKTYTVDSAGTETITADAGYDGLSEVEVSVPQAVYEVGRLSEFYTQNNVRRWRHRGVLEVEYSGWIGVGTEYSSYANYSAVPTGTTVTPSTSAQTIGGANYMMEGPVTVAAMPTGSATAPASISGTAATVSTGTNTLTLSKTVSVTPSVTAGYVSSGTAGNSSVSLTANVTTKAAATITPTTSQQTIASGTYLTGTQTISAVSQTNLTAENIKNGTTVTISNGQSNIFSVTGTYTGGGGSSDVVMGTLNVASNVNTSTSTTIATTSTIGFTPTKFFFWKDERTATNNHVHQASFVTIGTSYYVRTMTRYSNNALSTSGNANNWTTQTAGYLYFNSNTVYFRSSSSYILSSGTWHWVAVK